jgi:putative transposase
MIDYYLPMPPGTFFHVFNRGNNRDNIFYRSGNGPYFLGKYSKYMNGVVDTYAYCLLPNHFHMLVRVKTAAEIFADPGTLLLPGLGKVLGNLNHPDFKNLNHPDFKNLDDLRARGNESDITTFVANLVSEQFRLLFLSYAKAINKQEGRVGSLFQKNFKRLRVNSEGYCKRLVMYIHANPQLHRLCPDFKDWPNNSYHSILSDQPTQLRRNEVLQWFGDQNQYIRTHHEYIDWRTAGDWLIED